MTNSELFALVEEFYKSCQPGRLQGVMLKLAEEVYTLGNEAGFKRGQKAGYEEAKRKIIKALAEKKKKEGEDTLEEAQGDKN